MCKMTPAAHYLVWIVYSLMRGVSPEQTEGGAKFVLLTISELIPLIWYNMEAVVNY